MADPGLKSAVGKGGSPDEEWGSVDCNVERSIEILRTARRATSRAGCIGNFLVRTWRQLSMKCQECANPATIHITEILNGKILELHYCEEHARQYLAHGNAEAGSSAGLAGALSAAEVRPTANRVCPYCGLTMAEFRSSGRLGCPHDYVFFSDELEPLLINFHGETEHVGKRPEKLAQGSDTLAAAIELRKEMRQAVIEERYERAQELRDQIQKLGH